MWMCLIFLRSYKAHLMFNTFLFTAFFPSLLLFELGPRTAMDRSTLVRRTATLIHSDASLQLCHKMRFFHGSTRIWDQSYHWRGSPPPGTSLRWGKEWSNAPSGLASKQRMNWPCDNMKGVDCVEPTANHPLSLPVPPLVSAPSPKGL